ncbi:MAG: NIL domain-containing protein [Chloroflexi bacterium]|nr:NIL domain-containing protein [Chloroflexota bacterium]
MDKQRVKFSFEGDQVKDPIIYQLGRNFHIVTNIRRAEVQENLGWVILELDGEKEEIERGLQWVSSTGVRVDPLSGDVIEG